MATARRGAGADRGAGDPAAASGVSAEGGLWLSVVCRPARGRRRSRSSSLRVGLALADAARAVDPARRPRRPQVAQRSLPRQTKARWNPRRGALAGRRAGLDGGRRRDQRAQRPFRPDWRPRQCGCADVGVDARPRELRRARGRAVARAARDGRGAHCRGRVRGLRSAGLAPGPRGRRCPQRGHCARESPRPGGSGSGVPRAASTRSWRRCSWPGGVSDRRALGIPAPGPGIRLSAAPPARRMADHVRASSHRQRARHRARRNSPGRGGLPLCGRRARLRDRAQRRHPRAQLRLRSRRGRRRLSQTSPAAAAGLAHVRARLMAVGAAGGALAAAGPFSWPYGALRGAVGALLGAADPAQGQAGCGLADQHGGVRVAHPVRRLGAHRTGGRGARGSWC